VLARLMARRAYVGLHHRLDTPASGLMVLAVDRRANAGLAEQFAGHTAGRTYAAVLYGNASGGTWVRPVQGKSARTTVEIVGHGAGLSAARLEPHTGRKHQLRIHAALAGTPICGDRRHGGEAGTRWPRLALHATALRIVHPVTGESLQLHAPIPDDLVDIWTHAHSNASYP
jgi:23S rRNA pseudouridine1911/1915/1917 synthase